MRWITLGDVMNKGQKAIFDEIGLVIERMNVLLDKAFAQYEKGEVDEKYIISITNLIDKAYKKQLHILGR